MGTIYEIICWTTGRRYVGQTTKTLKRRLQKHESEFRNRPENCYSRLILEHGNYEMYELEKVEDESKLNEREYYYIQHTDCVNIKCGYYDRKQVLQKYNNSEKGKGTHKKYRETEKGKETQKKYKDTETYKQYRTLKVICECGIECLKTNLKWHKKSKQHQNWLATQP